MWTISNPRLPAQPDSPNTGGSVCAFDTGQTVPALAQIDLQAQYKAPDIITDWKPTTTVLEVPAYEGDRFELDISDTDLTHLDALTIGGSVFVPAKDSDNLQPGEFALNPIRKTVSVRVNAKAKPAPTQQIRVLGGVAKIPTDYVPSSLLKALEGLPVKGKITWTKSLEQHPSGTLELVALEDSIEEVRERLKNGTELTLFGIGFSVANFDDHLYEDGFYEISVSLTGKWARPCYNQPSFLKPEAQTGSDSDGLYDSDCGINYKADQETRTRYSIPIKDLAEQVDVPLFTVGKGWQQPASKKRTAKTPAERRTIGSIRAATSQLPNWSVEVPPDTPKEAATVWSNELQNLLRQNRCFIDWNQPGGVYVRDMSSCARWSYEVKEVETSRQGDCKNSPGYNGYAAEYANFKLGGKFAEPDDGSSAKEARPRWVPRSPRRVTLKSGDIDIELPPVNTTVLKTLSLNWDTSGPTKTLKTITSEDGMPLSDIEWIYGFTYLASEIVDANGDLMGQPSNYWGPVSYKITTYEYDPKYGYALGSTTTGWRKARFKTEAEDAPETLSLDPIGDQKYLNLYRFKTLPTQGKNRVLLVPFSSYYDDADEAPSHTTYKHCLRDGTSVIRTIPDPTWAPAMFVKAEMTYTNSFSWTPNPDSVPEEPLPHYTTGEESWNHMVREILPARSSRKVFGAKAEEWRAKSQEEAIDMYVERRYEDSAQGANFKDKAVKETFEQFEGRPSPASRKPATRKLEEPESESGSADQKKDGQKYDYFVCTPGYSVNDPSGGSVDLPAETVEQALAGAEAELLFRDLQDSVQYSYLIPFNPRLNVLDFVAVRAQHESFRTRVTSVENAVTIDGFTRSEMILTAEPTKVSAGIDRKIPVTLHKRKAPKVLNETTQRRSGSISTGSASNLSLRDLFPKQLQSRRSF
ncbi:hypothetical protein H6G00_02015 [Leptolyngbya sp. FACHB-541]|uniref:hypothetical protein n=1 Tax=Leptolyngbya sp. FACHB-541 TaxID=2692810 RepID=UPI001684EBDB|nr:hypothetical protein [Leptolyngbya sp. FACHB-541]MBD1995408.1 hypothetical protein [Leptolyngbya sp. FACHB-541]